MILSLPLFISSAANADWLDKLKDTATELTDKAAAAHLVPLYAPVDHLGRGRTGQETDDRHRAGRAQGPGAEHGCCSHYPEDDRPGPGSAKRQQRQSAGDGNARGTETARL